MTTITDCEFKMMKKNDSEVKIFIDQRLRNYKTLKYYPSLEPRESFYGGRTNVSTLYYSCGNDEKIYYYDFTSLYPFVCKQMRFPVGHPDRINYFESLDISGFNGLIYCVVLPPTQLYFPVLPLAIRNKLIFTLCYTCAIEMCHSCNHEEKDRVLIGIWSTPELNLALNYGYKILKLIEVWNFKMTNEGELFGEFINACIKGKIEASGWPSEVMSDVEKTEFIKNYHMNEGISLDRNSIEDNPGKRSIFKLAVNSFWGKFAQNSDKQFKTETFFEPELFFKLISDDTIEVNDAFLVSDHAIQVKYKNKSELKSECSNSNVVIASFVTSYARIELYKIMSQLGDRCLYFDTDSVIFRAKADEYIPQTGNYLGQLTSELKTNAYITKFCSCGPKTYAFEVFDQNAKKYENIVKVKGLSLAFDTEKTINLDSMKNIIDKALQSSYDKPIISVPQMNFITNKYSEVSLKYHQKAFRFVCDKRRIEDKYQTKPYGYKNE